MQEEGTMLVADNAGSVRVTELDADDPRMSLILDLQRSGADQTRTREAEAELLAETQSGPPQSDPFHASGETVFLPDDPSSSDDPSGGPAMFAGPLAFARPLAFAAPSPDCGQALFAG
jgi:hypothetical protein